MSDGKIRASLRRPNRCRQKTPGKGDARTQSPLPGRWKSGAFRLRSVSLAVSLKMGILLDSRCSGESFPNAQENTWHPRWSHFVFPNSQDSPPTGAEESGLQVIPVGIPENFDSQ